MRGERLRLRRVGGRATYPLPRQRIRHQRVRPPAHAAVVHEASEGLDVRVVLKEVRCLRKMVVERGGEVEDGMRLARPDIAP